MHGAYGLFQGFFAGQKSSVGHVRVWPCLLFLRWLSQSLCWAQHDLLGWLRCLLGSMMST